MNNLKNYDLPYFDIIKTKEGISDIRYFVAKINDKLSPELSGEDLRAIKDYPSIYVYVSEDYGDKKRVFYIGQSINIEQRIEQHKDKIGNKDYEKFNNFKNNGKYFVFYSDEISMNLNFIEKTLIMCFVKQFNVFNFSKLTDFSDKDDGSVSKELANRDWGVESGKYQKLREDLYDDIIKPILNVFVKFDILDKKQIGRDENYFTLFRQTPFYDLTESQRSILKEIMDGLNSDAECINIHGVKGDAGTGKTVLILHLIGAYINAHSNNKVAIYLKPTQRERVKKILEAYGIDLKNENLIIGTFNDIVNAVSDNTKYDLIIVDEAQRTTKLFYKNGKKLYPTGSMVDSDILEKIGENSQLGYFYKHTKNLVLAYDIEQNLRAVDNIDFDTDFISSKENRKVFFKNVNVQKCFLHTLKPQLRLLPKDQSEFAIQYIKFVKAMLGLKDSKKFSCFIDKNKEYEYIKIADSEDEWVKYIEDKQRKFPYKKSILISGLCKPKEKDNNKLYKFLKLERNDKNKTIYWSNGETAFRDYSKQTLLVGRVYDIQGFDVDFAGIYIGNDIYFCNQDKKTKTNIKSFWDQGTKKGLNAEEIDPFIRKSYYVLLTRAVHGQIWYIEDISLRNRIKEILEL